MRKLHYLIGILFLAFGLIAGCGTAENNETSGNEEEQTEEEQTQEETEELQEEKITVTLSLDDGEELIEEKEIPIEDGSILMDVMKEHFAVEEDGGFIQSIEGIAPEEDEEKAWMYFVNGEMATVGAAEYELSTGDEVTFDLQSWE